MGCSSSVNRTPTERHIVVKAMDSPEPPQPKAPPSTSEDDLKALRNHNTTETVHPFLDSKGEQDIPLISLRSPSPQPEIGVVSATPVNLHITPRRDSATIGAVDVEDLETRSDKGDAGGGGTGGPAPRKRRTSVRTSQFSLMGLQKTAHVDDFDVASQETRSPRAPGPAVFLESFERSDDDRAEVIEFVSLLPPAEEWALSPSGRSTPGPFNAPRCAGCKTELVPKAKFCFECGRRVNGSLPKITDDNISNSSDVSTPFSSRKVYHRQVRVSHSDNAVLGRGTNGVIYKAIDAVSGQPLAVKEMPLNLNDTAEVQTIRTELRHLSKLRHPHVVQYLGCMVEDQKVSILMERLECGSLSDMVKQFPGGIPEAVVQTFALQILRAIEYCHQQGTTHRDIKPANILQSASGVIKLSDFGSAIVFSTTNADDIHVAGTPAYMPPEVLDVLKNKAESFAFGTAHDIWSVGCSIHEMLTGHAPWSELGLEPIQLVMSLKNRTFQISDALSATARSFLTKCLSPDMKSRATATELLQHPFISVCDGH